MPIIDFLRAFRSGQELANAKTWKVAQVLISALSVFIGAGVAIAKAYGVEIDLSNEQIFTLASSIAIIAGLFNGTATVVSTDRIGLPSGGGDVLPGTSDGVRHGSDAGRPYEWIRELDDRNTFQMPDIKDKE